MYKTYLIILGLAFALACAVQVVADMHFKPNFLFRYSNDFSRHRISVDGASHPGSVVFVGSSATAGQLRIPGATIADFLEPLLGGRAAYDLATQGGDALSAVAYGTLSLKYKPALILYGISENDLEIHDDAVGPISINEEIFRGFLPSDVFDKLRASDTAAATVIKAVNVGFSHFTFFGYGSLTYFEQVRRAVYGDVWDPDEIKLFDPTYMAALKSKHRKSLFNETEAMDFIGDFRGYAHSKGAKTVVFLPPEILSPPFTPAAALKKHVNFKEALRSYAEKQNIGIWDYSDLVPESPKYFSDRVHLTELGRRLLAKKLKLNIESELAK